MLRFLTLVFFFATYGIYLNVALVLIPINLTLAVIFFVVFGLLLLLCPFDQVTRQLVAWFSPFGKSQTPPPASSFGSPR